MPRRFIDLSVTLDNETVADPPFLRPSITYQTYADTKHELRGFFQGADTDRLWAAKASRRRRRSR